ncbi:MAG: cyclic nucleotide-binding domain-containing protein [Gammaproteobacteria bacterium]|nr:cyclic nucleotide-binding domain-containing protein [Gammaproteobacteria bacterium]MCW9032113.1 cyclic nucleotide-binding domain-containing protein [Gammaproteobacteria bacterium]
MSKKQKITIEQLQQVEPLSALSLERLEELKDLVDVEELGVGVTIFREGDVDNQSVYLLNGDVQMTSVSDHSLNTVLTHKANDAKHPLAVGQPRQLTCTAMTIAKVLRVDNSILDYMLTWDQLAVAEEKKEVITKPEEPGLDKTVVVSEDIATSATDEEIISTEEDGRNWIRRMRHIMAFKNMPPANIKSLLQRMETISVDKDEVIIEQGSPGDFYYVLTEGEALVTRTVELASLGAGASFGEEALLSGSKRNASVTMTTPGQLMRLAKDDFNELLKEPLLDRVTPDEALVRVAKGNVWLDVRHVTEFNHSHLPKARNIPLHELRMRMKELDKEKEYICYCGTGRRSSAASFLLVQNGFKVVVLVGGVQKIPQLLVKN